MIRALRIRQYVSVAVLGWLAMACASRPIPGGRVGTATTYNEYSEDLAAVRPTYTPPAPTAVKPAPTTPVAPARRRAVMDAQAVNRRLDAALDTMAVQNRQIRYAPGFRIQVYVGNERQVADNTKLRVYQTFPELNPYLNYKQPTYTLKVGDFMRRLDAERYFATLKTLFPQALLQADRVDIRRSLSTK